MNDKILMGLPGIGAMSMSDEAALAKQIQKHQKEDDRNELVLHSLREAVYYARGVSKGRLPEDELMSVCYTALLKAAKNFKPGMVRFFAYAKPYVRGEICSLWKSKDVVKKLKPARDSRTPVYVKRTSHGLGDRQLARRRGAREGGGRGRRTGETHFDNH